MRRLLFVTLILLLSTAQLIAADADKTKNQISIFSSDLGFEWTNVNGSRYTGGLGLALARSWTPRWSTEIAVAREQHFAESVAFDDSSGRASVTSERFHVFPVDVWTQYRFVNSSRWTPYVGAGWRYVHAPSVEIVREPSPAPRLERFPTRSSGQIGAGTALRITPHFGLRFDGAVLLSNESMTYDPRLRASFGVNWRF
ncbi:MAG TPA: outer membrane beta-barrel protein [Thermoanaerobaculia bacterium]